MLSAFNPYIGGRFAKYLPVGGVTSPVASTPYPDQSVDPTAAPSGAALSEPTTLTKALAQPAGASKSVISIGPPPTDALAQALLANEQAAPLATPFEAVGKLAQLWGGTKAEQDYQKKLFERQAAPAQALSQALAGIPADTPPAQYRQVLARTLMDVGGRMANPDMVSKGAELMTQAPSLVEGKDAAGNSIWFNPLDPTHPITMDQLYAGQAGGAAPDGSGGAPGASGVPTGQPDPYASPFPRTMKPSAETEAYTAYLADARARKLPPEQLKPFEKFTNDAKGAARTQVMNNINTSEGFDAAQAKARIDADTAMVKEASTSALNAERLSPLLDDLIKTGQSAPGGYAGELAAATARAAAAFGADIPESWSDAEKMKALSQLFLPAVRQPGAVSNYEQQVYMQAIPSLMQSQPGRVKAAEVLKKMMARSIAVARVMRDNIGQPNLYDKIGELDKPVLSKDDLAILQGAGNVAPDQQGAAPPGGAPPTAASPRPRATNPNTGEVQEFDGQKWVPVQK